VDDPNHPIPLKFVLKVTHPPFEDHIFDPISAHSDSTVRAGEKVQLELIRSQPLHIVTSGCTRKSCLGGLSVRMASAVMQAYDRGLGISFWMPNGKFALFSRNKNRLIHGSLTNKCYLPSYGSPLR